LSNHRTTGCMVANNSRFGLLFLPFNGILPLHRATLYRGQICCPGVAPGGNMAKKKPTKKALNDRVLRSLKPAEKGTRYDIWDTVTPELAVRVTDKGAKTFTLTQRFPRSAPNPTRRSIGVVGAIDLVEARKTAREWIELVKQGVDPAEQAESARRAKD